MSNRTMRIGLLLYQGCVVSGLFSFAELLHVANKRSGRRVFDISWVGIDDKDVEVTTGSRTPVTKLSVDGTLAESELDAVLVPGFWTDRQSQVEQALSGYQPIVDVLKQLPKKTKVWAYCTGVSMLAASGRLEGRTATATWWLANYVQTKFKGINWSFSQTCINTNDAITASGCCLSRAQHLC